MKEEYMHSAILLCIIIFISRCVLGRHMAGCWMVGTTDDRDCTLDHVMPEALDISSDFLKPVAPGTPGGDTWPVYTGPGRWCLEC